MTTGLFLLILLLVLIGAMAQRIAGLGFALLIAPFLVLLLGPREGVILVNICGVVSSALIMSRVWKDIDWRMFAWLVIPSVLGSVPGSLAAVYVPTAPLAVIVGGIVLIALTVSLVLQRSSVVLTGNTSKAVAGFSSGLTNAMAGVGGPAVSIYALLARWPQRPFAATIQPFFVVIGLVTLAVKLLLDPAQVPPLDGWMWVLVGAAIIGGIFAGEQLARFIRDRHARFAVIVIAFLGAATALVNGLLDLLA